MSNLTGLPLDLTINLKHQNHVFEASQEAFIFLLSYFQVSEQPYGAAPLPDNQPNHKSSKELDRNK